MKIYTRGGDQGKTSLVGGERVSKADERIEAYGDVDELNSILGYLGSLLESTRKGLAGEIRKIQSDLFLVGARLAAAPGGRAARRSSKPLPRAMITSLEEVIERMDKDLEPLQGFILPGGHPTSALAHVARTVCRRAERRAVRLLDLVSEGKGLLSDQEVVAYLNRLSDYLFVLARYCNHIHGVPDVPWEPVEEE